MIAKNLSKKEARSKFKEIRRKSLINSQSKILNQVQITLKKFFLEEIKKGYIGIYWPLKGEIDLRAIKNNLGLPLALPVSEVNGKMTYRKWGDNQLTKDAKGIPAPLSESPLNPEEMRLLLVPALAVDQKGNRLGYGGGFFDRLRTIPEWKSIPALLILPKACITQNSLPIDDWDIPFDGLINEEGLLKYRNFDL